MTPAQAGELDRVISALHSLEPRAAEAVADRRDLITGEVTVESFRYLRRPDEEALRKVQSPLLFIDPSTADLSSMPFHQPSAEVLPGLFEMEFSFPPQYERGYVELEIEDSAESDNMPLDDFLFCVRNTFPELIFVGGIALAAGQPWIEKGRGSLEGASDRTSLVSKRLSKIKGWRFQKQVWAPTLKNPDAGTRNVGRFIARWIPYVGLAVILLEVGMLAGCYAGRRMK